MLHCHKITDKIIRVSADSQRELGSTFIRFQEHYESPEWKDKIFTEGQLRAWYSEKYGQNTYEVDWTGFNIPSSILDPFIKGLFDPLAEREKDLVDLFKYRTDKFYIIGSQHDDSTLDHEICHGLFYTNQEYQDKVLNVLRCNMKKLKPVAEYVSGLMYHPSVVEDEVHAYVSANPEVIKDQGIDFKELKAIHKQLRAIKEKYYVEAS